MQTVGRIWSLCEKSGHFFFVRPVGMIFGWRSGTKLALLKEAQPNLFRIVTFPFISFKPE